MQRFYWIFMVYCLVGCQSNLRGSPQSIFVNTPGVEGAVCAVVSVDTIPSFTPPTTIEVSKGSESITIKCKKTCYYDGALILASSMERSQNKNLMLDSPFGVGYAAVTGASNTYVPRADVLMRRDYSCRNTQTH